MSRLILVASLALLACSTKAPPVGGCKSNSDCAAGSVCTNGTCAALCTPQSGCEAGFMCVNGACTPTMMGGLPDITDVTGNNPSDTLVIADGLIITGTLLDAAQFEIRDTIGGSFPLTIRSQAADRVEVVLPIDVVAGDYTLVATNAAGFDQMMITLSLPDVTPALVLTQLNLATGTINPALLPTSSWQGSPDISYSAGNVGIGTSTPGALLHTQGRLSDPLTGTASIIDATTSVVGSGTSFTTALQVGDAIRIGTQTFTVTAIADDANLTVSPAASATEIDLTVYADLPIFLAIDDGNGVAKLTVTRAGDVGIGTASPVASLDLGAKTDGLILPKGTTADRPASPVQGTIRYNTTQNRPEYYDGTVWIALGPEGTTGGVVTEIGGYRIHTFTRDGYFTTRLPLNVDVLVVGGGGGGGYYHTTNANGGGGGGGVIYKTSYALIAGTTTVTVGAGGANTGGAANSGASNGRGRNGQDSVFGTLVAFGGGGGGATGSGGGANGGSGGGASSSGGGGTATQMGLGGYGNNDGPATQNWTGGGGAGSAGISGNVCSNCAPSGDGGAGYGTDISGTMRYYAGGGGGSANSSERAGNGRDGGGRGAGSTTYYDYRVYRDELEPNLRGSGSVHAIPHTGGGGSYWHGGNAWMWDGGGRGGSGIVILRYPIP